MMFFEWWSSRDLNPLVSADSTDAGRKFQSFTTLELNILLRGRVLVLGLHNFH